MHKCRTVMRNISLVPESEISEEAWTKAFDLTKDVDEKDPVSQPEPYWPDRSESGPQML